jgi:hypothetical protein
MAEILNVSQWIAVISLVTVVLGWFASSWLSSKRERKRRQDEMRLSYLVDAYEKLALASSRALNDELARSIESAVAKIQLFGTLNDIKLVRQFLDEWRATEQQTGQGRASLDPLLFALRDSVRQELSLPAAPRSPIRWIRPMGGAT